MPASRRMASPPPRPVEPRRCLSTHQVPGSGRILQPANTGRCRPRRYGRRAPVPRLPIDIHANRMPNLARGIVAVARIWVRGTAVG